MVRKSNGIVTVKRTPNEVSFLLPEYCQTYFHINQIRGCVGSIELIKINEVNNVKVGGIWNEQRKEVDTEAAEICG